MPRLTPSQAHAMTRLTEEWQSYEKMHLTVATLDALCRKGLAVRNFLHLDFYKLAQPRKESP